MIRLALRLRALVLFSLTACGGHAVDLDRAPPTSSPSEGAEPPLVEGAFFKAVWVEEQRLSWLGAGDEVGHYTAIGSCLTTDCEHTKLRYSKTEFGVASIGGGYVYWPQSEEIRSCPASGCGAKPTTVIRDPGRSGGIFANGPYVYWTSDFDLYRCPASGCGATPEVVAFDTRGIEHLAFDERRVYWIDLDATRILSAPADGSESPKLLIEESSSIASLAVGNGRLYWTVEERVFGCPVATCSASTATLLASANAAIDDLRVDESAMYWLEADTLHSCSLMGCERATVLTPVSAPVGPGNVSRRFALDADYVYWLERTTGDVATAIRRTAK